MEITCLLAFCTRLKPQSLLARERDRMEIELPEEPKKSFTLVPTR